MALKGCKVVAVSSCVAGGSDATLGQECGSWSSSPPGAHSQVAGAPRKMVDSRFATLVGGNIIFRQQEGLHGRIGNLVRGRSREATMARDGRM